MRFKQIRISTRPYSHSVRWAALLLGALLISRVAGAADSVPRLSRQLLEHEDFRVRTQAALALGASGSDGAVDPLCKGLGDQSTTVRAAAAAGLGKLKRGGEDCLERRLQTESTESVKAAIRKTLDELRGEQTAKITPETRFYVSVAEVTDPNGRELTGLQEVVRGAMIEAMRGRKDVVFAPMGEKPDASRKRLKGRDDIKGFYLAPKMTSPEYVDGNLTVRLEFAIFSYPTKVLKGMLPIKLTEQGGGEASRAREEKLVQMAAGRAMEKLATQMERIR